MSAADRRYGSRGRTRTSNLPDLVVASRRRCPSSSTQVTGMAGRRDTCLDVRGRAPVATRVATRRVLRRRLGSSRTTPQTDARVSGLRSIVAALHRRVPAPRASVRRRRPDPDGPGRSCTRSTISPLVSPGGNRIGSAKSRSSVTKARRAAAAASATARSDCPDNPSSATVSTSWPASRRRTAARRPRFSSSFSLTRRRRTVRWSPWPRTPDRLERPTQTTRGNQPERPRGSTRRQAVRARDPPISSYPEPSACRSTQQGR